MSTQGKHNKQTRWIYIARVHFCFFIVDIPRHIWFTLEAWPEYLPTERRSMNTPAAGGNKKSGYVKESRPSRGESWALSATNGPVQLERAQYRLYATFVIVFPPPPPSLVTMLCQPVRGFRKYEDELIRRKIFPNLIDWTFYSLVLVHVAW